MLQVPSPVSQEFKGFVQGIAAKRCIVRVVKAMLFRQLVCSNRQRAARLVAHAVLLIYF
jgi:hypothetical protein